MSVCLLVLLNQASLKSFIPRALSNVIEKSAISAQNDKSRALRSLGYFLLRGDAIFRGHFEVIHSYTYRTMRQLVNVNSDLRAWEYCVSFSFSLFLSLFLCLSLSASIGDYRRSISQLLTVVCLSSAHLRKF